MPDRNEPEIRVGQEYITRSGQLARIHAVQGGDQETYPILGEVYHKGTDSWSGESWTKEGYVISCVGESPLDLIQPNQPENKEQHTMNIQAGKKYLTRDYLLVYVYATDTGGEYPVHAAIYDSELGSWWIQAYDTDGKPVGGIDTESPLALLREYDWREEIPWSALRPEIQYVAMNETGKWYGYKGKVELTATGWRPPFEEPLEPDPFDLSAVAMPEPDCHWTHTLVKRPQDKTP